MPGIMKGRVNALCRQRSQDNTPFVLTNMQWMTLVHSHQDWPNSQVSGLSRTV